MALNRPNPESFDQALRVSKELLSRNPALVDKGVIDAEAEQIVFYALRKATGKLPSRIEFFSRMSDRFPDQAGELVIVWSIARAQGKLLQHLTGAQYFLDHEYEVGPDVLIPRPETEVLVQRAAEELRKKRTLPALGIEIGVGSGIISIELLSRFASLEMHATELTVEAEARARLNARKILGPERSTKLHIYRAKAELEVFGALPYGFPAVDFIISNPPYLSPEERGETDLEVAAGEPSQALFAPSSDVLHFYREIAEKGAHALKSGGMVFVEIPHERASLISTLFFTQGWSVEMHQDLTGRDRVLVAKRLDSRT